MSVINSANNSPSPALPQASKSLLPSVSSSSVNTSESSDRPSTVVNISSLARAQATVGEAPQLNQASTVIPVDEDGEAAENDRAIESREQQIELSEQQQIKELSARDQEVRNHEQAHASVGGQYAGSPTYEFQRGPDGVSYAVGGHVSIDASAIPGNPEATIVKAAQVRRAALAPAEPSPQDRKVASLATQTQLQAQTDLAKLRQEERQEKIAETTDTAPAESEKPAEAVSQSSSLVSGSSDDGAEAAISKPQASSSAAANFITSNDSHSRIGSLISQTA